MNEEMNNNYNNVPNYNYEKNNNGVKVLLIILIILVLCLIGLTCYKIFIYDKKNDNKKDNNVVENKVKEYEKINYEIKNEEETKKLYVNDKSVDLEYPLIEDIKVEQLDDVLIVSVLGPGPSRDVYAVDKDSKVIKFDYRNKSKDSELFSYGPSGFRIENKVLYIKDSKQYGNGYVDWYCKYNDKNAVIDYEIKYDYLGNGKFSNGTIVNEKSISEVYKEELKNCE